MKYKVGDMTVLGEINTINEKDGTLPYGVRIRENYWLWLSESEIDAIIVKPKRNIDHLIELIDKKKGADAVAFIDDCRQATLWLFWIHMLDEYSEPSRYPKLTPDELNAVKWLVEGGYEALSKNGYDYELHKSNGIVMAYVVEESMPFVRAFSESKWITETPIDLKELLEAQEGV